MQQVIMETKTLQLPQELAKKIGTRQVIVREVKDGLLLLPLPKQSNKLRGMLKGGGFSSERYFEQKQADKELEK